MGKVGAGGVALYHQFFQRAAHAPNGGQPPGCVHHNFCHHRVVIRAKHTAGVQRRVHPHAAPAGEMQKPGGARRGPKPGGGVLGVDAHLQRVAAQYHVALGERQRQPRGNAQLLAHKVQPGDQLGHAVLYLNAGVHLNKIIMPLFVQHKFNRAGPLVPTGGGRLDSGFAHGLPQRRLQRVRRGFFHQFLVFALD